MGYYRTTLQKGSQGDEVKKWQEYLNTQGYNLTVDGDFGINTYNATVAYQKANGLGADGIVGKNTWSKAGFKLSPSSQDFSYGDFSYDDFNYDKEFKYDDFNYDKEFKYDDFNYNKEFKYDDFNYGEYPESDSVKNAGTALDNHLANKPGQYQSQWQANIDALMDKILNREDFSYDLNEDALYQQYKDQYMTQGKLAMEDTIGQAAAMTGGYGNSYATSVGNQAYQAYLGKLNEVLPELYQLALNKYNQEGQELYTQYDMLSDREKLDYGRFRDALSDYLAERDYLTSRYDSERDYDYSKYNNERNFAYNKYSSDRALAYDQYYADRDFEYNKYYADRALAYDQYSSDKSLAYDQYSADKSLAYDQYSADKSLAYDQYSADRALAYDEYSTDKNFAYQQYRNAIADEQWWKQYYESVRQYNEQMALEKHKVEAEYGELSPEDENTSNSGGSGGSGGYELTLDDVKDWETIDYADYFAAIKEKYGVAAAVEEFKRFEKMIPIEPAGSDKPYAYWMIGAVAGINGKSKSGGN